MDVFLLGAGPPARGKKPSALKKIALGTKVMDWQIHSFAAINEPVRINYLGGYQVDEVIQAYPELNFTVIPNWEQRSVLHTLLQAPFSSDPVVIAYSDTIFRREKLAELVQQPADIVFGVDSDWRNRYTSRSVQDIHLAEKIQLEQFDTTKRGVVEYTGLTYLKPRVVNYLSTVDELSVGTSLLDLLFHLQSKGFSLGILDVAGHWAEFNEPEDIAHFILGSKAETLARLEPLVRQSYIGRQVSFTIKEWWKSSSSIVSDIKNTFNKERLVVRSSAKGEDNWSSSNAGGFESLLNIEGHDEHKIKHAVDAVIRSYGDSSTGDDQVLVQAFLQNVSYAGVVFTCGLETGSPYYRFNFDDKSQSTESVTAGVQADLRVIIINRYRSDGLEFIEPKLIPVLKAVQELEQLLGYDKLDIEFAVDGNGRVHIFQVRPVTIDHSQYEIDDAMLAVGLKENVQHFFSQQASLPFVYGERTLFGNMPDWNPAEIIGTRPKPLAFSLYRQLITNEVWAAQRAQFGYRDVRPHPLIVAFSGQPYVDVRASFNSFIPEVLSDRLASNLVNAYLTLLMDNPQSHDKVEFDVAFTIWTPTFHSEATQRLGPYGLSTEDIHDLGEALKQITRKALTRLGDDIKPIQTLVSRREKIADSDLRPIDKVFSLLDDCRRYGTLAFSHAARAGFIATTLLKSFVSAGILSESRRAEFMTSVKTVASEFEADKSMHAQGLLSREQLIARYGHLRPGTYEISAAGYWEDPEYYLMGQSRCPSTRDVEFTLTSAETKKIQPVVSELGADLTPSELFDYLQQAIQTRERVKFDFTHSLSKALDFCLELCKELSLIRQEMAYLEYHDLEQFKLNAIGVDVLKARIRQRQKSYIVTQLTELPALIIRETDFYCFERHASQPNFITTHKVEACVHLLDGASTTALGGCIVLIPQADPGYDWLFGHGIAGLVTKYGGANSHMAIRAAEIGLPAAIGVGDKLYERISRMHKLELDCASQIIREIQ